MDEAKENPENEKKPKISLNPEKKPAPDAGTGVGPGKNVTMPLGTAAPTGKDPVSKPKISISKPPFAPAAKSQTSRISVNEAKPPADGAKAEEGIPLTPEQKEALKRTMRIETLPDGIHDPRNVPGGMNALGHEEKTVPDAAHNQTMKIDLTAIDSEPDMDSMESAPEAATNLTMRIDALPEGIHEEEKIRTGAIQAPEAASNQTMRIEAAADDQVDTGDTQAISLDAEIAPDFDPETKKEKTSRITLDTAKVSQDVLKRRTGKISIPIPPPNPKEATGKGLAIKRPSVTPPKVVKKPLGPGAISETVKKASAAIPPPPSKTASGQLDQTRKLGATSTLKLDLPPELKSIKPKTMTIKRSDGTTTAAAGSGLKVKTGPASSEDGDEEPTLSILKNVDNDYDYDDDTPGAVFAVAAVLTLLVSLVVVYILLGQTFAPDLPFAGRI